MLYFFVFRNFFLKCLRMCTYEYLTVIRSSWNINYQHFILESYFLKQKFYVGKINIDGWTDRQLDHTLWNIKNDVLKLWRKTSNNIIRIALNSFGKIFFEETLFIIIFRYYDWCKREFIFCHLVTSWRLQLFSRILNDKWLDNENMNL